MEGEAKISVCSKLLEHFSLEESLEIAARIGYDGIEFFGIPQHLPPDTPLGKVMELKGIADNLGVKVSKLTTYCGGYSQLGDKECDAQIEDFKRYIEMALALDCDLIRAWPGGPFPWEAREDHWLRSAYYLQKACDLALAAGLRVVIETIQVLPTTVDATLRLVRMVDRPNFGITYDPGALFVRDPNYGVQAVHRFGDKIFNFHVKDRDTAGNLQFLGEGNVDYRAIFRALKDIGYTGYYAVESHVEHSTRTVEREFEAVRGLLAEVGHA